MTRTADQLRTRLAELRAEVDELDSEARAERFALDVEADGIRKQLNEMLSDDLAKASKAWSVRSGRKGEHGEDPGVREAQAKSGFLSEGGLP